MALEILVVNSYNEDNLIHTFLEKFQQSVNFSDQIAIRQAYLRRKEKSIDQKSLSISDLQIDYLNLEDSGINNWGANFAQPRCSNCKGSHTTDKWFEQHRK